MSTKQQEANKKSEIRSGQGDKGKEQENNPLKSTSTQDDQKQNFTCVLTQVFKNKYISVSFSEKCDYNYKSFLKLRIDYIETMHSEIDTIFEEQLRIVAFNYLFYVKQVENISIFTFTIEELKDFEKFGEITSSKMLNTGEKESTATKKTGL